ncbi:hypothetical protein GF402_06355 [Candidatus Fermentibacteria bacterium]|nr:hypothetical protein [Candidatus Fermentibacteria bacterium]
MLKEELEQYVAEKEKVRKIIGQIGGKVVSRRDRIMNAIFVVLVGGLFFFDLFRHLAGIHVEGFPPLISLEIAVLLVSLKIIWMIHQQARVYHFQFWVLNSIEFQMNSLGRKIGQLEDRLAEEP